jgi:hypothetical protein
VSEIRVDSRWWYWVAAVPVVAAFWAASALWVAVVVLVVPEADPSGFGTVLSIPAVALGIPALVTGLVLPLALWRDAQDVRAAGADWPDDPTRPPKLAVAALVVVLAGVLLFFEGDAVFQSHRPLALLGVAAGVAGDCVLCVRYLRSRSEVVDMPSSLWEWREELREETAGRR